MAKHIGTVTSVAISQKPIPFVCATCGGPMQMIETKRRDFGSEGVTHCPTCDKTKEGK